jgi:outer membrane lipoprotein-sorting protein
LNKQNREVQYRSIDYLQEVTEIPFDFKTVQDLLIGNPVFYGGDVKSYKHSGDFILITYVGEIFKNLLTLSTDNKLLKHIKLDDIDIGRNRTADITYDNYENNNGINFSTNRQIIASEKNKLDIRLNFKQYEFNKELSVTFNIPKNYKVK